MQILFAIDLGHTEPELALSQALQREKPESADWEYTARLVRGTWGERQSVDATIARFAREWRPERMAGVDRNVLRLAIYELEHVPEVPAPVIADEAVILAQTFSTADSGKFVNGILGAVIRERGVTADARGDLPGN